MPLFSARQLQQRCVQQVVNRIAGQLAGELDLNQLADIAGFSRFHFLRVFKAVTGESPYQCIRRLRLEWAAKVLVAERHVPVAQIAFDAGFNSQQAFARAFQSYFRMSATRWRDGDFWWYNGSHWDWRHGERRAWLKSQGEGRVAGASRMYYLDHVMADAADGERPAQLVGIEVREVPGFRLAYMRDVGTTSASWDATWRRLWYWAKRHELLPPDAKLVFMEPDNPTIVAPEHMRSDLGITVTPGTIALPEVDFQDVPGGKYAFVDIRSGTDTTVLWEYVWQHWMPANHLKSDVRRSMYTIRRFTRTPPAWTTDMPERYQAYVPIKRDG